MKFVIETNTVMHELRNRYSGTIVIEIEECEVVRNFNFTLTDAEEGTAVNLIIQKEAGTVMLDITGATEQVVSALPVTKIVLMALVMPPIEKSMEIINTHYESPSSEITEQYKEVEKLASMIGGNVQYSANVYGEAVIEDTKILHNLLQVLEIPS